MAREKGCGLTVFPELSICGYPPRDLLEHKKFILDSETALESLMEMVPRDMGVICGIPYKREGGQGKGIYNSAVLFEGGKIIHVFHKRLLPSYDIFDETRYFENGEKSEVIRYKGLSFGITICEDIWSDPDVFPLATYSINPLQELSSQEAELFINISASPYETGKPAFRKNFISRLSAKYKRPFVYVNAVGGQDGIIFDGNSFAVTQDGIIISHARAFEEDMIVFDSSELKGDLHTEIYPLEEEIIKAIRLSLLDYMRRCGFKKVVLGLSGGVDSALTACISQMSLGKENVLCIIMPSPYTSMESIEDATALSRNLGIDFHIIPITDTMETYLNALSPVFSGRKPDTTEENIQARIRGNLLMAISNKFGHLVLSTGNKSELAVGYCTLYGDLSGGFALISDLPKTMVYRISRHINATYGNPIPERILTKAPSAELRPDQKDQDDLPPYAVLDAVIELYIEKSASMDEIISHGFDPEVVRRIIFMINRSEYKRRQAPPGPRITSKALGCGRRYPLSHSYHF
jgi:NAD+ synthetase